MLKKETKKITQRHNRKFAEHKKTLPAYNLLLHQSCSNNTDETKNQKELDSDASIAIEEVIDEELEEFKLTKPS